MKKGEIQQSKAMGVLFNLRADVDDITEKTWDVCSEVNAPGKLLAAAAFLELTAQLLDDGRKDLERSAAAVRDVTARIGRDEAILIADVPRGAFEAYEGAEAFPDMEAAEKLADMSGYDEIVEAAAPGVTRRETRRLLDAAKLLTGADTGAEGKGRFGRYTAAYNDLLSAAKSSE